MRAATARALLRRMAHPGPRTSKVSKPCLVVTIYIYMDIPVFIYIHFYMLGDEPPTQLHIYIWASMVVITVGDMVGIHRFPSQHCQRVPPYEMRWSNTMSLWLPYTKMWRQLLSAPRGQMDKCISHRLKWLCWFMELYIYNYIYIYVYIDIFIPETLCILFPFPTPIKPGQWTIYIYISIYIYRYKSIIP